MSSQCKIDVFSISTNNTVTTIDFQPSSKTIQTNNDFIILGDEPSSSSSSSSLSSSSSSSSSLSFSSSSSSSSSSSLSSSSSSSSVANCGDVIVVRIGNGTAPLSVFAAPVFLDRYNMNGGLVSSTPLPTTTIGDQHRFTMPGSVQDSSTLTRSLDGRYLLLVGYDAPVGAALPGLASQYPRVIARIDSDLNIDTSTTLEDAYSNTYIRGVTSTDGTEFWVSGGKSQCDLFYVSSSSSSSSSNNSSSSSSSQSSNSNSSSSSSSQSSSSSSSSSSSRSSSSNSSSSSSSRSSSSSSSRSSSNSSSSSSSESASPMLTKSGVFSTTTGTSNIEVTGVGFMPKVVLFYWNGQTSATDDNSESVDIKKGFGYAVSTSDRRCCTAQSEDDVASDADAGHYAQYCVAILTIGGALDGALDLVSLDSDGFTLAIDDAFSADFRIGYLALGGDALTDYEGGILTEPADTGDQDITTLSFQPDCVLFFSPMIAADPDGIQVDSHMMIGAVDTDLNNAVLSGGMNNGSSVGCTHCSDNRSIVFIDSGATAIDGRASVTAWLANGFRLNWAERASSRRVQFLALKGGNYLIGNALTRNDTNDITESGFGFTPTGALCFSTHSAGENADDVVDTSADLWCIGSFSDTSNRNTMYICQAAGFAFLSCGIEYDGALMAGAPILGLFWILDIKSMDSDGFTLVHDLPDADGGQFIWYLALG